MSRIRVLIVSTYYADALAAFYRRQPLDGASYAEQHDALMAFSFGWADFWQKHLEANGDFAVTEIVANAEPLQRTWLRENRPRHAPGPREWFHTVLREQILALEPDILFLHDLNLATWEWLAEWRRDRPGARVLGYDGVAVQDWACFRHCDAVLVPNEPLRDYYRQGGFLSECFKLGFAAEILDRMAPVVRRYPVTFVGQITHGNQAHHYRRRVCASLVDRVPLRMWSRPPSAYDVVRGSLHLIVRQGRLGAFARLLKRELGPAWEATRKFRGISSAPVFGLDMYQVLADSGITLNVHIDASGSRAGNMRMFEATGVGTCLVTDWKENLPDFFEPDREVVTFRSPEECIEKIRYLLQHETKRQEIARAGQRRTLATHTLGASILAAVPLLQRLRADAPAAR